MARLERARVLSVALLALTLVAGFLAGTAWQRLNPVPEQAEDARAGEERGRGGRRLVIDQVGLEPAQRAEVDDIMDHFRARARALDREFEAAYAPRQRELFRHARDSIKTILAPEQQVLYDSLLSVRFRSRGDGRDSTGEARDRGRPNRR